MNLLLLHWINVQINLLLLVKIKIFIYHLIKLITVMKLLYQVQKLQLLIIRRVNLQTKNKKQISKVGGKKYGKK